MKILTAKKALVVAVASLVAGGAFAAFPGVNLDSPGTPPTYASELDYSSGISNGANQLDLETKLGFGVSASQNRYIRLELTNAKFAAAFDPTLVSSVDGLANVVVSQGGAAGQNYVILQITSGGAGNSETDTVFLGLPAAGITIDSTASNVTVSYQLHETAVSAVAGATGSSLLYKNSGVAIVKFAKALSASFTKNSSYADVAAVPAFSQFDSATPWVASLGTVTFGIADVLNAAGGNVAKTDLVDTAADKNVLTVGGSSADFSSTIQMYLSSAADCSLVDVVGSVAGDFKSAAFDVASAIPLNTGASPSTWTVCYQVAAAAPTNPEIAVQQTNAAIDYTEAATALAVPDVSGTAFGEFLHNGTELQGPWFTTNANYVSRFVLTSQYTQDADYKATLITEDGNTCTTPGSAATGTLKAGKQLIVSAADICAGFSANTRAAVVFTVSAPNDTIQGVYNVVNPTTGSISVSSLLRRGTN
ncbi:hypothetical protein GCM10025771_25630 [Niveibacterium umoris]|uniref:Uncharacterized protein n=1 Tax=Niveibacterium umoris TaxID=1193620 RepID=A0A840BL31_9RHOO|nr:hypothetical protein [Niveibacterium umoris]MBB4012249.1 hypothetical protein [Niveibacterium umoris]